MDEYGQQRKKHTQKIQIVKEEGREEEMNEQGQKKKTKHLQKTPRKGKSILQMTQQEEKAKRLLTYQQYKQFCLKSLRK